ncbi:hypothetical protein QOT17_005703 [Balamuthia mandrillaris]
MGNGSSAEGNACSRKRKASLFFLPFLGLAPNGEPEATTTTMRPAAQDAGRSARHHKRQRLLREEREARQQQVALIWRIYHSNQPQPEEAGGKQEEETEEKHKEDETEGAEGANEEGTNQHEQRSYLHKLPPELINHICTFVEPSQALLKLRLKRNQEEARREVAAAFARMRQPRVRQRVERRRRKELEVWRVEAEERRRSAAQRQIGLCH